MDKKLNKMKTDIEIRLKRLIGLVASTMGLLGVAVSGVIPLQHSSEGANDFILGFQIGLLCTLLIFFASKIVKYRKALKDEKQLKQLYYKENDERMCYINQQVGKSSMSIITVIMVIGAIVAGYFNVTVFGTILVVILVQGLIQKGLIIYYTKNMSGEDV